MHATEETSDVVSQDLILSFYRTLTNRERFAASGRANTATGCNSWSGHDQQRARDKWSKHDRGPQQLDRRTPGELRAEVGADRHANRGASKMWSRDIP